MHGLLRLLRLLIRAHDFAFTGLCLPAFACVPYVCITKLRQGRPGRVQALVWLLCCCPQHLSEVSKGVYSTSDV
eukprot:SAG25_NODE_788_length_5307_cov_2.800115_4_plen_74_part_00